MAAPISRVSGRAVTPLYRSGAPSDPAPTMRPHLTDNPTDNPAENPTGNPTAEARRLARAERWREAEAVDRPPDRRQPSTCPVRPPSRSTRDRYSPQFAQRLRDHARRPRLLLPSSTRRRREADTVGEYYRAEVTAAMPAFPVDLPLHSSGEAGRQILLYPPPQRAALRRPSPRRRSWRGRRRAARSTRSAPRSPLSRSAALGDPARRPTQPRSKPSSIHRLFHARLVDPGRERELGGRVRRFYVDQAFRFLGATLTLA